MIKLTIYLKNGHHFSVIVKSWKMNSYSMTWINGPEEKPTLGYVVFEDISAIVTEQLPEPTTSEENLLPRND